MSDYLNGLGVANLAALDNADPQDTEDASQLAAAIRQIKSILVTTARVSLEDTGQLKPESTTAVSVPSNNIDGSADNSTTAIAGKIKQGTLSTNDLRNLAVATAKIADLAVTAAKIALATITSAQLADNAVTTAKITDLNVTTGKLADLSVTAAKIAALTITGAQVANGTLSGTQMQDGGIGLAKLANGSVAGQLVLWTGSAWAPTPISSGITINGSGVATIVGSIAAGYANIREKASKGTPGGASTSGVDLTAVSLTGVRGNLVPWNVSGTLAASITVAADGTITISQAGSYLFLCSAPAFGVGVHKISIQQLDSGATTIISSAYGTSEFAAPGQQTQSFVTFFATVTAGQKFRLRHYCQNAVATNGFGIDTNTSAGVVEENFAIINLLKF